MEANSDIVNDIREFNRFYTNILGLLDRHILNSAYSLTEARVLYELHACGSCTANALSEKLNVDKSYMSRIISRFTGNGLLSKTVFSGDGRAFSLELTQDGQREIDRLIWGANRQIEQLIAPLSGAERREIQAAMDRIQKRLTQANTVFNIRPFTRDDLDYVIDRQLRLYEEEYGFTSEIWKSYVTNGVRDLVDRFQPEKDGIFILEANGSPAGCIAVARAEERTAQLRFFFLEPSVRGLGAGGRLVEAALGFCREKGYGQAFLWTCDSLTAARHLYAKYGFHRTDTHPNREWGTAVLEERWELEL